MRVIIKHRERIEYEDIEIEDIAEIVKCHGTSVIIKAAEENDEEIELEIEIAEQP